MKKLLTILLVILCFCVMACSKSEEPAKTESAGKTENANTTGEPDKKEEKQSESKENKQVGTDGENLSGTDRDITAGTEGKKPSESEDESLSGNGDESLSGNDDGNESGKDNEVDSGFTPDIPSSGGINYEYEIVSAYDDNGNEASWNHMTWFVSYRKAYTIVQAPIWEECAWEDAIGTEEERLPAGFKKGELTLTSYSAGEDYMGALGSSKTLRFDIKGGTATVYNVDDGITYNCVLYRSFTYKD